MVAAPFIIGRCCSKRDEDKQTNKQNETTTTVAKRICTDIPLLALANAPLESLKMKRYRTVRTVRLVGVLAVFSHLCSLSERRSTHLLQHKTVQSSTMAKAGDAQSRA